MCAFELLDLWENGAIEMQHNNNNNNTISAQWPYLIVNI